MLYCKIEDIKVEIKSILLKNHNLIMPLIMELNYEIFIKYD